DGAGRPCCHPGEDGSLGLRSVIHTDGGAPGVAFVGGEPNEYIVIVRIAGVGGAVRRDFDREEKMSFSGAGDVVGGISNRRQPRGRRNTYRDAAIAATDINGAVILIDRNTTSLANCAGSRGVAIGKAPIH